jgi:NADPH:quinone reductase-like Zn-dependent oxidoreductase
MLYCMSISTSITLYQVTLLLLSHFILTGNMGVEIPKTMKALVGDRSIFARVSNYACTNPSGDGVKATTVPVPEIKNYEILVRVRCVALNPTDFKHIDILSPRGAIIGCDYSGTVAKIGTEAPGNWTVGDRVAGWTHGGLYTDRGSFAEYLKIPGDLAWKVPPSVSDEQATTFGVSAVTAMLALNVRLGVPWIDAFPVKERSDTPLLIYSGSTAVGLYAIQLSKLAGLKVVTTASPKSHDLVKEYGADDVFDYRSPTAVEDIIQAYPNIDRAMDCFSEGGSTEFCARVVHKSRGWVTTLLDSGKTEIDGVKVDFLLAYTVFNEEFQWLPPMGPRFSKVPSDNEALRRFYGALPEISKQLKPPPLKQLDGGLGNLSAGLDLLRQGRVSGTKLVARLD